MPEVAQVERSTESYTMEQHIYRLSLIIIGASETVSMVLEMIFCTQNKPVNLISASHT